MFKLPVTTRSLGEIEEISSKILPGSSVDLAVGLEDLKRRRGALHDAAFTQLLVTWARKHTEAAFVIDALAESYSAKGLEDGVSYSPAVAAIRLAGGIRWGGKEITRHEALSGASQRILAADAGDYGALNKGRCVDMICVSGASSQYLWPLFSARDAVAVRPKTQLEPMIRSLLGEVAKGDSASVPAKTISALGSLTHELFLNTQEHAIHDLSGRPYVRHVEGLFASWTTIDEDVYGKDFDATENLKDYWKTMMFTGAASNTGAKLRVFVLSFFDSGPGMACRFTGKSTDDLSKGDELDALMTCLKMHQTSKSVQGAGGGLTDVLGEVKKLNGLIRIRSGRQSIYNCFTPGVERDLVQFESWHSQSTELAAMAGTVVSVVIPLHR